MTIFGQIITGADVENAVLDTLKEWSSTYIAEMERQQGLTAGDLPRIRNWTMVNEFEKWPEDQLPCVIVVSTGTAERPLAEGRGQMRARWQVGIGIICSARENQRTLELAKMYAAALRTLLLQRQSLGGFARGVDWLRESYDDVPVSDGRNIGAAVIEMTVEVGNVTTLKSGPVQPDPEPDPLAPFPNWPVANTVDVTVEKLP